MKKYIKQYMSSHLYMLILLLIVTSSTAYASYKLSDMMNALEKAEYRPAVVSLILYIVFQGVSIVALVFNNRTEAKLKFHIRMDLRKKIIHNTVSYRMSDFYKTDKDDFTDVQVSNLDMFSDDYLGNIYNSIYYGLVVIFGIIVFGYMYPLLSILLLASVFLSYVVAKGYNNKVYKVSTNYIDARNDYNRFISDMMNGFLSLYTFNTAKFFLPKGNDKAQVYEGKLRGYRFKIKFVGTVTYLPMFLIDIILLSVIIVSVITSRTGIGTLAAFLNLGGLILNSGEGLFGCLAYLKSGKGALENDIIDYVVNEPYNKLDEVNISNNSDSNEINQKELFSFVDLSYHIEDKEIVSKKNYNISCGDKVIITGANGSGKSTLLQIISKLIIPTGGEIYYKGNSYANLKEVDIFTDIAYLPQESYLFDGTLYENIFFDEKVSKEILSDILKKSALDEFVEKHIEGLSYHIDAGGDNLSGGEKRRVCIARMLAKQKNILLMDEPTAGIDEVNASKIESALMNQEGLTLIMITHDVRKDVYGDYKEMVF